MKMALRPGVLLDFVVVLIVAVATLSTLSTPVSAPKAETPGPAVTTFAIALTNDGTVWLDGQRSDEARIVRKILAVRKNDAEARAVIAADRGVPHERVEHFVELVHRASGG